MHPYTLTDLIDIEHLQALMDLFYNVAGFGHAISDKDGNILTANGWQEICTNFHRVHSETNVRCIESDTYIHENLEKGKFIQYRCKNGMWDMAAPIVIANQHIATIYYGQFFFEDETIDIDFFIDQARRYHFDETSYIDALKRVPIITRKKADEIMAFYTGFVEFLGNLGLSRIHQLETEKALRKSENQYRELVQSANSAILRMDTESRITFFNIFAQKLFGYTEEEVKGKSVIGTIVPKFDSSGINLKSVMDDICKNPTDYVNTENENISKTGDRLWMSWTNKAIPDESGKIKEILCVGNDVTRRKTAEEALKLSEDFHRSLFEDSPTPMFMQDFNQIGKMVEELKSSGITNIKSYLNSNPAETDRLAKAVVLTKLNRAALKLYKAESCEIPLQNLDQILIPGERSHFIDQIETFSKGGNWYEYEARNRTLKGDIIWVIIRKTVIQGRKRDLSQILTTVVDVTERNLAQAERARLESRLRQSHKMEAIGTLAGGVAHDFNNILAIMIGNTELALDHLAEGTPAAEHLNEVVNAGLRARDVIGQLVGFSRKNEQKMKIINIETIIHDSIRLMRSLLPKQIEISVRVKPDLKPVLADATQIHQIMMNLCTNASHAMKASGGELDITLSNKRITEENAAEYGDPAPGEFVELIVRDTGHGIDPAIIDKIFDPYFTTKEFGEGTGMGLTVVHGVIKNHGGGVSVKSKTGSGTAFHILFQAAAERMFKEKHDESPPPTGTETILLIDDEESIVKSGKDTLEGLGYTVHGFSNPIRAIEHFKSDPNRFDLVITDMAMPKITGDILSEKLLHIKPDARIIICTGYSGRLTESRAEQLGIKAFIVKPMLKSELATAIRQAIDQE